MHSPSSSLVRPIASLLALLLAALLLPGCASTQKKTDWSARVGSFKYDDAVLEMGPPDKEARLTDGTIIAQWLTRRGYSYRTYHLLYGGWVHTNENPPGPDQYLTLTFGADGVLREWKTVVK